MNVDFITAIKLFFANYVNFKGRSTRAEFWWATLFCFLVNVVLSALGAFGAFLTLIASLVFLLPSFAIATRRLHDTGRSGWWLVAYYVFTYGAAIWIMSILFGVLGAEGVMALSSGTPQSIDPNVMLGISGSLVVPSVVVVVLSIIYLVFMCLPSGPDNQYGPDPYGEQE